MDVGVVMGSISDWEIMENACLTLEEYGVDYEKRIVSAHRTPYDMVTYAEEAATRGLKVIIAGAGGAAHLPGMIAAYTILPVIGVPVNITALNGMDSLLSIVQMPKGVPVATVAIDNSTNAALLAIQILAISDETLTKELLIAKQTYIEKVQNMNKKWEK